MTLRHNTPMHRSAVLENLDQFRDDNPGGSETKLMRSALDMCLLWKVIQHFCPQSFLEIGFGAGQTMGIMYEASKTSGRYLSVDINYRRRHIFEKIWPAHTVAFYKTDSRIAEFESQQPFDFVHIDGDHSYQGVINDLKKTWPIMHEQTILYMDDYLMPGVDSAIREEIMGRSDFRPFLYGDQSVFFHHQSQSKDDFVDYHLQEKSHNFIYYLNEEIYHVMALRARLPNVFMDYPQIFIDTLRAYDL